MHFYKTQTEKPTILRFEISEDNAMQSLKSFLNTQGFTRTFIKSINLTDRIEVNGNEVSTRYWLMCGDIVLINCDQQRYQNVPVSKKVIVVVFEDDFLLVVNKEQNVLSLPIKGVDDSMASRVAYYYQKTNQKCGIHLLTRLDYGTKGLMLFAKSGFMHGMLMKEKIIKEYYAEVEGEFLAKEVFIDKPIGKDPSHSTRRVIDDYKGKKAMTSIKLLENKKYTSIILASLHTGRTHQIRLHLSSIGHPIIGDVLYNKKYSHVESKNMRLALTCVHLSFQHPMYGEKIDLFI